MWLNLLLCNGLRRPTWGVVADLAGEVVGRAGGGRYGGELGIQQAGGHPGTKLDAVCIFCGFSAWALARYSLSVSLHFLELHRWQHVFRFSSECAPPRESGTRWSIVADVGE